jgi:hypothetical protein
LDKRFLALLASEHHGGRKKCAVKRCAIIVGEFDQAGFNDETANLDQVARALATLHDPLARVMPSTLRLKPATSGFTAAKCLQACC